MSEDSQKLIQARFRRTSTRFEAAVFRGKVASLQAFRFVKDMTAARPVKRLACSDELTHFPVLAESISELWSNDETGNAIEKRLLAGKVQNLRLAARRLHGVEIPANEVFSFWAQVGRATRRKGYAEGRELREGCIVPNVGGGLCQFSNALYDAALRAGFEIIERHAHTQIVTGSLAESGRDATVFWNYVDLRFRSARAFRIEVLLTSERLIVRFRGEPPRDVVTKSDTMTLRENEISMMRCADEFRAKRTASASVITVNNSIAVRSLAPKGCASCDAQDCFRHQSLHTLKENSRANFGRTAFLVDEFWAEHDAYISEQANDDDLLCLPLDGKRFGKRNYAWGVERFREARESRLLTLLHAWRSRRLAAQGAARQLALLERSERLAESFAARLSYDVTHVVVMQNLLPFLWRAGHLGGRTFDVLMTGLPLAALHETLDAAHRKHPESGTLNDFRADAALVACEAEALSYARRIVTPHAGIAAIFSDKAFELAWRSPQMKCEKRGGAKVIFPAATVGRKGAYEMREAARALNLSLAIMGAQLEGADFWRGLNVERRNLNDEDWLRDAALVPLPAYVENRPRRLLEAVARGVPVIATDACGLSNVAGVTTIPTGDVAALCAAIKLHLTGAR